MQCWIPTELRPAVTMSDSFRGSYYFVENSPIANYSELDRRLRNGELRLALELPTGFQKDLQRGRQPDVNVFIDAAQPFRAETARGYVESVHDQYQTRLRDSKGLPPPSKPIKVEARALYNQAFKSIYAMVPGDIMLLLILIPSMLTALSVVREKELGSIANFYAAPATRLEFLAGKQLPYIGVALVQFATLVALAILLFRVPLKGKLGDARPRWSDLRTGHHGFRSADFGVRTHANRSNLCRRDNNHSSGGAVLRNVCSGIVA